MNTYSGLAKNSPLANSNIFVSFAYIFCANLYDEPLARDDELLLVFRCVQVFWLLFGDHFSSFSFGLLVYILNSGCPYESVLFLLVAV